MKIGRSAGRSNCGNEGYEPDTPDTGNWARDEPNKRAGNTMKIMCERWKYETENG